MNDSNPSAPADFGHDVSLSDLFAVWYKRYVEKNFERAFVISTLLAVIVIGYFVDNKLAVLNFFYLPVFLAAHMLESRLAVLGSIFSCLVVFLFAVVSPESFLMDPTVHGLYFHLLGWGSFLILTGALVSRLNEKLRERYQKSESLVKDLRDHQQKLEKLQGDLMQSNEALDLKNRTIEALKEKVEAVLYSTMDPEVARLVVNRQLANEKKFISVLFGDLQGFTPYSEGKQPEVVIEELNKYFAVVEPVISRFRGHLDKFVGDGVMAEFGAPLHFQQHALLSVLAALQMRTRVREARLQLPMRIGIATGTTIVGLTGSTRRKSYSAFGDTVNLAQRLETLAAPGSVFIDETTYNSVSRFIKAKKVRMGLTDEGSRALEEKLADLERRVKTPDGAKGDLYFEAGKVASQLGELPMAVRYFKEALREAPKNREEIEKALAQAVMLEDDRGKVEVKGRRLRVSAFEVVGLSDPLQDTAKFPAAFYEKYKHLEAKLDIAPEALLSIEALDGSIGQSRSTALLSYALAEALGAAQAVKDTVLMAGYLHHVGKRYIPDHLLNREDADYDLQVITVHVSEAEKVISEIGLEVPEPVVEAIRHHHEVFSGGGYPSGQKGENIPLSSRIVQVASQYDTRTSWKPYRDAWNRKAALSELKREAEMGRYDPKVVEALIRLLDGQA